MMPDPGEPRTSRAEQLAGWDSRSTALPTVARLTTTDTHGEPIGKRLAAETATVRAELLRVDQKANSLLAIAGVLLAAGLAVLATGKLPVAATVAGWTATTAIGAAVVLLAVALCPALGGQFGFVRWAQTTSAHELLHVITNSDVSGDPALERATELRWLSAAVHRKYVQLRRSVTLILVGLAGGAVAAALTAWGL
jgi:hypothetical protein